MTLSAEQFEKLYLSPMIHRQPALAKNLGNPTPLGAGSFVLTAMPLACCLMGWRGAGGSGAAFSTILILLGGLLLLLSCILGVVLGNTFTMVVFGHLGAFCLAFDGTVTPASNAAAPYYPDGTDTLTGLHSADFVNTFAFFFVFMALIFFIYTVCVTRTNFISLLILPSLIIVFSLFASAYWNLDNGDLVMGNRLTVGTGAALFFASMLGFYLLTAQLFYCVGFPISLSLGDLNTALGPGRKQKAAIDPELAAEAEANSSKF